MPQHKTREDFEQAVIDTLTTNGGTMEYGAMLASLSEYVTFFRLLPNLKRRGVYQSVVVAGENGPQHIVSLPNTPA